MYKITLFTMIVLMRGVLCADVKLPSVVSDHMVLQQGMDVPLWGWADPGERVTVSFQGQRHSTLTDKNGTWNVRLSSLAYAGPSQLIIEGSNRIVIDDVLVGEVWLASGQSNMHWELRHSANAAQELEEADWPEIRLFHIPRKAERKTQKDTGGRWVVCSGESAETFSAVAYFFGRDIHQALDVPVGLINCNWGGATAEAWMSAQALRQDESFIQTVAAWDTISTVNQRFPSGLYNAMLYPLSPFALSGVLWYQGEGNDTRADQYREMFPALIEDWRRLWRREDLPFLFVQLANYDQNRSPQNAWAELREAQLETLRTVANTAMAVTIDIGDPDDIHPVNKQDVGKRLALAAMATVYGQSVEYSGPLYKSMRIDQHKIVLSFEHTTGGLSYRGKSLDGFQIAGRDRQFSPARAVIDGESIIVWHDQIDAPVAVRYGWSDNPENANLYNGVGLPASPFRTDDWPFVTAGNTLPRLPTP